VLAIVLPGFGAPVQACALALKLLLIVKSSSPRMIVAVTCFFYSYAIERHEENLSISGLDKVRLHANQG
jgi:hypothetical protein